MPQGERLQRVMADAGIAARRVCERMIEQGHVTVNGQKVRQLPVFVDPARDDIRVDGRPLQKPGKGKRHTYIMLNKPARTLVSTADEPGADRTTVLALVDHPMKPRLFPVGRLDYDTTGLVLLTTDGDLAHRLTHPRYGVAKTYHILVKGIPDDATLAKLEKSVFKSQAKEGRERGRIHAPRVELSLVKRGEGKSTIELTMREGRNRHVRDALSEAGFHVKKFEAVRLGPLELAGVAVGRWRELDRSEVAILRKAAKLTGEGADIAPGAMIPREDEAAKRTQRRPVEPEPVDGPPIHTPKDQMPTPSPLVPRERPNASPLISRRTFKKTIGRATD